VKKLHFFPLGILFLELGFKVGIMLDLGWRNPPLPGNLACGVPGPLLELPQLDGVGGTGVYDSGGFVLMITSGVFVNDSALVNDLDAVAPSGCGIADGLHGSILLKYKTAKVEVEVENAGVQENQMPGGCD
jgi:hypothetical protein